MEDRIIPIGGEQWFNINLFDNRLNNFCDTEAVFLSGGQSAIQFILEDIRVKDDEYILVPSYLCPTILHNFKRLKIRYRFYKINKDLSINLYDVRDNLEKFKINSIFFIDYFGFYHNQHTIEYLKKIQNQGITIIEDAVQMLWFNKRNFIGDYVFNSYRKFIPIDGSIILCNKIKKYEFKKDNYYEKVNCARIKKTAFQNLAIGNEGEFLDLYEEAEEEYYKREYINGMDEASRRMLSKIDYKFIFNRRKENYFYLHDRLVKNNNVKIIFKKDLIIDNSVLGLPILIDNRDEIRKKLRLDSIYCPVHWNILNEKWSNKYVESRYVSKKIITLPIDQRYNINDMERLAAAIEDVISNIS